MEPFFFVLISLTLVHSSSATHGFAKKRLNTVENDNTKNTGSNNYGSSPAAAAPYAGPTPAAVYQNGSEGFSADCLTQHNDARAKYGANPVSWSAALYPDTQAYANNCVFQPSNGSDYSENLYVGGPRTTKPYPIMDAVNSWMGEASEFIAVSNKLENVAKLGDAIKIHTCQLYHQNFTSIGRIGMILGALES